MRWPNSFGGGRHWCQDLFQMDSREWGSCARRGARAGGGGGGCPVDSTILGEAEEARAAWAFEIYLKCLGNSKFCPTSFSLHLVANKINSK
jgi:hypothetical protein